MAQGGLPRELVFELSKGQSLGKEEGVRGMYSSTGEVYAKAPGLEQCGPQEAR